METELDDEQTRRLEVQDQPPARRQSLGPAQEPLNRNRDYGPGQHGQRRKKPSDFGTQLMAKQKLKGYYGNIGERQFRRFYEEARGGAATPARI